MKAKITRALSIRQPYAEQILRGSKVFEFRSMRTTIRERVYVYASKGEGDYEGSGVAPGSVPTGVLVGTVEIVDCLSSLFVRKLRNSWGWRLARLWPSKHRPLVTFSIGIDDPRTCQCALHPDLNGEERCIGVREPIYSFRREIEGHVGGESKYPSSSRCQNGIEAKFAHDHAKARPYGTGCDTSPSSCSTSLPRSRDGGTTP